MTVSKVEGLVGVPSVPAPGYRFSWMKPQLMWCRLKRAASRLLGDQFGVRRQERMYWFWFRKSYRTRTEMRFWFQWGTDKRICFATNWGRVAARARWSVSPFVRQETYHIGVFGALTLSALTFGAPAFEALQYLFFDEVQFFSRALVFVIVFTPLFSTFSHSVALTKRISTAHCSTQPGVLARPFD